MSDRGAVDGDRSDRAPIGVVRIIAFVATAVCLVGALQLVPTDASRAFSLTAGRVARDDLAGPLMESWRESQGTDADGPGARLVCEQCDPASLDSLRSALGDLVAEAPHDDAPELRITLPERANTAVLIATLEGVSGAISGARRVGDWRAVVPPLFAILVAFFFRRLVIAMVGAVLLGGVLHFDGGAPSRLWEGARTYYWGNIVDEFNLAIVGFAFALVGMIMVATRSGGSQGLIELTGRVAKTARSTRVATALMGLVIFFDDYANTIVVGTTARTMTDRQRISREKLAYLVDSTAAPVAGLAIISTWIAYEVGLLQSLLEQVDLGPFEGVLPGNGYAFFLAMLPLRFYCLTCLAFVFVGALSGRDFGPMLRAERRAARTGELLAPGARPLTSRTISETLPAPGVPPRWQNAVLPVAVVIFGVIAGLLWNGRGAVAEAGVSFDLLSVETWKLAFGGAQDTATVLLCAALAGSLLAIGLAVGQRVLSPKRAISTWLRGIPAMSLAVVILLSAWAIKSVCDDLGTNVFLVSALGDSVSPAILPLLTFVGAAAVAFATGTSWGTMGILLPIVLPWAFELTAGAGTEVIVLMCAAAVLDGAILGDHCSPISDTTVMSSIASGCDHVDHVRTQMPYALTCMVISATCYGLVGVGVLPTSVALVASFVSIVVVFFAIGRRVDDADNGGESSDEQTDGPENIVGLRRV